ncbi:MAG: PAS domain-containing protein, partial [Cyanobacteria bacterium J06649_11]
MDDEFWGFTISFIWLDEFIKPLELEQLVASGYSYQLSRIEPLTGRTKIFLETDTKHLPPSIEVPISVPDSPDWILRLSLNQPIIPQWLSSLIHGLILGACAFIAYSLHRFLAIPEVLSNRVKERTKALNETNQLLQEEIEERTFIEKELKLARLALEESSSGVVITKIVDVDGKIRHPVDFVNKAFTKLTGYTPDEIIGNSCNLLQGSDTSRDEIDSIRVALRDGGNCKVTLKNYRKNGSFFWNELTISPIRDDHNKLTGFIGFQVDVTDRLEAQSSLKNQYEKSVLIRQITEKIRAELESERIFQTTVDLLGKNLGLDRCIIHDVDPEQQTINCVAEYLVPGTETMLNSQVPIAGNSHAEKVLRQDQAVSVV